MNALANILGAPQDRCVLSVQMVDDILARWGGLRPLIDICFAFDGNWPANPFGKNPATAILRGDRRCMQSQLLAVGPYPQWVERFYKAINSVWLYQEAVNFLQHHSLGMCICLTCALLHRHVDESRSYNSRQRGRYQGLEHAVFPPLPSSFPTW
jgi:hypothetical protein